MSSKVTGGAQIPAAYASFHVLPNASDDPSDERMPKNLAQACLLFHQTNNDKCLDRLHEDMGRLLSILAKGPDGKTKISIGKGCICWSCGFVGLPSNAQEVETTSGFIAATCKLCSLNDDTNFIEGRQPDGSAIPFIEADLALA